MKVTITDEVLTAEEAAALLKVSVAHVYNCAKKKIIPSFRMGTRYCFSREKLMEKVRGEDKGKSQTKA